MPEPSTLPPLDPRQRYNIDESCAYLRVSRDNLYRKIRRGDVRLIKDGRRSYVPGVDIIRLSTVA